MRMTGADNALIHWREQAMERSGSLTHCTLHRSTWRRGRHCVFRHVVSSFQVCSVCVYVCMFCLQTTAILLAAMDLSMTTHCRPRSRVCGAGSDSARLGKTEYKMKILNEKSIFSDTEDIALLNSRGALRASVA